MHVSKPEISLRLTEEKKPSHAVLSERKGRMGLKKVKKALIILSCIGLLLYFGNTAHAILFTFDDLEVVRLWPAIESYMEDIYGSDISVIGACTCKSDYLGSYGLDTYIRNFSDYTFLIQFVEVPIISMSFDWQVFAGSGAWLAYDAEDNPIGGGSTGAGYGTTPPITFSEPAYKILFVSTEPHSTGVDNLKVTPMPEPASMLLVASGLLGLAGLRKRAFYRKAFYRKRKRAFYRK